MPVGIGAVEEVSCVLDEQNPSLVIILEEWLSVTAGIAAVASEVLIARASSIAVASKLGLDFSVPMPRVVHSLLARVQMRGSWSAKIGKPEDFILRDRCEVTGRILTGVVDRMLGTGGACISLFPWVRGNPAVASLVATLLRNLDPVDFASLGARVSLPAEAQRVSAVENSIDVDGTIAAFSMRSIRMLDSLDWVSPAKRDGWQVILGDNASGKTSMLRSLALCLLDRSDRDALRQGWNTWLRHGTDDGIVRVDLADNGAAPHVLRFELRRVHSSRDPLSATVDIHSAERVRYAGFLAAYGPFRRFTGGDPDWIKDFRSHPRLQSVLTGLPLILIMPPFSLPAAGVRA